VRLTEVFQREIVKMNFEEKGFRVGLRFLKAKDWLNWKEVFLAFLDSKDSEMRVCLDLNASFGTVLDPAKKNDEEVRKNTCVVRTVYSYLILAMDRESNEEGSVAFQIVKRHKDDARQAWKRLIEKFEATTTIERDQLMKRFYSSKCFPNQDPNQYIMYLEEIRDKICDLSENKKEILDVSFISHVIGSLPEKYHSEGLLLS
jgi:hypothetical protein